MKKYSKFMEAVNKQSEAWVLEDVGLSKEEWEALDYEDLLKLPIVKKLTLNPCGGHTRFPGSELQDIAFKFQVLKGDIVHHGGCTNRGEAITGMGKELPDAVRSAIRVYVELLSRRGGRT